MGLDYINLGQPSFKLRLIIIIDMGLKIYDFAWLRLILFEVLLYITKARFILEGVVIVVS